MQVFEREDGWPTTAKAGWLASEFDTAANARAFSPRELELLTSLVEKTKEMGLAVTEITREVFTHPELEDSFADWVRSLKFGQGLLQLKGFPVRSLPEDDIWRMYWGIGSHFGIGVSQNTNGQLQGKVTVTPGIVSGRVYGTSTMASLHSDRIDFLTLLCINKAKSGGENVFVSTLKAWELIEAERPDILALLKRGYPQHRMGEEPEGCAPVTPYRVPVFGEAAGLRSCYIAGNVNIGMQQRHFGDILTDKDVEALDYLRAVLDRPELHLRQMLEPGEAVFINNMEIGHSRAAFDDGDGPFEKRLLLRMWLQGRPIRPIPQDMRVIHNPDGNLGILPKPMPEHAAAA
jgi:hypothetical protein